jgi:hypothetical protein
MQETLHGHEKNCRVAFHMEPSIFRDIASYLREDNLIRDTRGVRVEEQLGMFMFMLSHNAATRIYNMNSSIVGKQSIDISKQFLI